MTSGAMGGEGTKNNDFHLSLYGILLLNRFPMCELVLTYKQNTSVWDVVRRCIGMNGVNRTNDISSVDQLLATRRRR